MSSVDIVVPNKILKEKLYPHKNNMENWDLRCRMVKGFEYGMFIPPISNHLPKRDNLNTPPSLFLPKSSISTVIKHSSAPAQASSCIEKKPL